MVGLLAASEPSSAAAERRVRENEDNDNQNQAAKAVACATALQGTSRHARRSQMPTGPTRFWHSRAGLSSVGTLTESCPLTAYHRSFKEN